MKRAVVNSSPLIYLSKAGYLHLLWSIYEEILIPKAVYVEVVEEGKKRGYADASVVEEAISSGRIRVEKAEQRPASELSSRFRFLDKGEAEVLALALQLKPCHVIVDDKTARLAAYALGLEPHGTVYIVLRAALSGLISPGEALVALDSLVLSGMRLSVETYIVVRKEVERMLKTG